MFGLPPLPRTLAASLRDLASASAATRAQAIADLARHAGRHGGVRAQSLPMLEKALREDESPVARSAAAVALGDLRAHESLPALLVAIEDADAHVRQMAINALGEIGDGRATARVARALTDERTDVRYQALIAYAKLEAGDDLARALVHALGDNDPAVRYIALRIAEERAQGCALDKAVVARARAIVESIAREPPKEGEEHVVLAAAILLAKMGEPELASAARPLLLRVVRGERVGSALPEKEDEREAVELTGTLNLREAVPHLEKRAWGIGSFVRDTCAWHAKIALASMGHARAIAEILRDLESTHPDTLAAAIVAAGRARIAEARARIEKLRASEIDPELVKDALAQIRSADRS